MTEEDVKALLDILKEDSQELIKEAEPFLLKDANVEKINGKI